MGWFSNTPSANAFSWKSLDTMEEWNAIMADQSDKVYLVFKHSTRCGISSMALKGFEKEMQQDAGMELYLLDLLNHRDISAEIESATSIQHQSPQAIVVKAGKVLYSASHHSIDATEVINTLKK